MQELNIKNAVVRNRAAAFCIIERNYDQSRRTETGNR